VQRFATFCHCRSVQVLRAADNPNKMRIAP
jgi:hypothetical protein